MTTNPDSQQSGCKIPCLVAAEEPGLQGNLLVCAHKRWEAALSEILIARAREFQGLMTLCGFGRSTTDLERVKARDQEWSMKAEPPARSNRPVRQFTLGD